LASTIWHRTIFVAVAPASAMAGGGELEQIQFLLGHASVQTTERYIGCKQNLKEAVNDRFGISVESDAA
jgi:integrase